MIGIFMTKDVPGREIFTIETDGNTPEKVVGRAKDLARIAGVKVKVKWKVKWKGVKK